MGIALYRKYRPQKFNQISGQNHIKITLQNEIELNKISHAYLFCGPRGVGKTTMARLFSKAINCKDETEIAEPCNKCDICEAITAQKSVDIIEIDAASHTGVDNVRENIISNARFTPHSAKYKVFIIDEVHMLSLSAFNALLKILEEPPKHVIFILATTEIHKVPITIISRCQRFDFKKINIDDLIARLKYIAKSEGVEVDNEVFHLIAKHAEGCLRDAESLFEQILSIDSKKVTLEQAQLVVPASNFDLVRQMTENFINKDTARGVELIDKMIEQGVDLLQFTDDLIEFLRKALIFKIDNNLDTFSTVLEESKQNQFLDLLKKIDQMKLIEMLNILFKRKLELKNSSILQLPLELAVIEICTPRTKPVVAPQPQTSPKNQPQPVKQSQTGKDAQPAKEESKPVEISTSDQDLDKQVADIIAQKKTEKQEITEKPQEQEQETVSAEKIDLTLDQVKEKWANVLDLIKEKSYSLHMNLQVADLLDLNGNSLRLGFQYDLQRSMVAKQENTEIIRVCLKQVFNANLDINPVVDENVNKEKEEKTKEVLDVFGAEIVD